jgi:hypothetical protein
MDDFFCRTGINSMSWNYRIVKWIHKNNDINYSIREVYYDKNLNPEGVTSEPCYPFSSVYSDEIESSERAIKLDFLLDFRHCLSALNKPTLIFREDINKFVGEEMSIKYEFDCGDLSD